MYLKAKFKNDAPKLVKTKDLLAWKEKLSLYMICEDERMWICTRDGYSKPTRTIDGRTITVACKDMDEEEKLMFEAEDKAHAAITMSLPQEISQTSRRYTNARDLWEALERRYGEKSYTQQNHTSTCTTSETHEASQTHHQAEAHEGSSTQAPIAQLAEKKGTESKEDKKDEKAE